MLIFLNLYLWTRGSRSLACPQRREKWSSGSCEFKAAETKPRLFKPGTAGPRAKAKPVDCCTNQNGRPERGEETAAVFLPRDAAQTKIRAFPWPWRSSGGCCGWRPRAGAEARAGRRSRRCRRRWTPCRWATGCAWSSASRPGCTGSPSTSPRPRTSSRSRRTRQSPPSSPGTTPPRTSSTRRYPYSSPARVLLDGMRTRNRPAVSDSLCK